MAAAAANTSPRPVVPADAFDRVMEALSRMRKYLPGETQRKLGELFDADNLLVLGVVLAVWAGLQITPIGWIADWAMTLYGLVSVGGEVAQVIDGVKMAIAATSDGALEAAAQKIAAGFTDVVVDGLLAVLSWAAFKRARAFLKGIRAKLFPEGSRFLESGKSPAEKPTELAGEKPPTEPAKGGAWDGVAASAVLVGATHASRDIVSSSNGWKWGLGAGLLLAALGVGTFASTRTKKPKRKWAYGD